MRTLTITLGDREHSIPVAPLKRAARWREQLRAPLNEIMGLLTIDLGAGQLDAAALKGLADQVYPLLVSAPETLLGLIFAYAPELEADRERIEAEVYDEEVIDAFLVILKAAFPLGRFTSLLGSVSPPTSMSSPSRNGASPSPSMTMSSPS